jgi:hypothetical protein
MHRGPHGSSPTDSTSVAQQTGFAARAYSTLPKPLSTKQNSNQTSKEPKVCCMTLWMRRRNIKVYKWWVEEEAVGVSKRLSSVSKLV